MAIKTEDVRAKFESLFVNGDLVTAAAREQFAPDIKITAAGRDFVFGSTEHDLDSLISDVMGPINSVFDKTKKAKLQIIRIFGSPDQPWWAIEAKGTATTKAGKPWVHECFYTMCFNADGKISEMKVYADTQHVHNHIVENVYSKQ